ncbi:MAG: hypothetical protein GY813_13090 [Halieaceae bacterium]|nr:hypothetical protein [Halieaceae bacterium]
MFAKLSQLVQSALDGYNVRILGQKEDLDLEVAVSETGERAGSGCLAAQPARG